MKDGVTGPARFAMAIAVYGLLLGVSAAARSCQGQIADSAPSVLADVVDGTRLDRKRIRIAYRDYPAAAPDRTAVLLLIHGSPGCKEDFDHLAPLLAHEARTVTPDLPGFGASTRALPDYSFRSHATYLRELLDQLGIGRVHVVGYSMGGGVALTLADQVPERVASVTLLSAVGVQEFELTGDYFLNHALHGAQLGALWLFRQAVPHMGLADDARLGVSYARNFFDSDQRPLRQALRRLNAPTLIIHGTEDPRVPVEAAYEHARLVPHSESRILEGDHFLLFTHTPEVSRLIGDFIGRVEQGRARGRADAEGATLQRAIPKFASSPRLPPLRGMAAWVSTGLLIGVTLFSDVAGGAAAGAVIAGGRLGATPALGAVLLASYIVQCTLLLAPRRTAWRPARSILMRRVSMPAFAQSSCLSALIAATWRIAVSAVVAAALFSTGLLIAWPPAFTFVIAVSIAAAIIRSTRSRRTRHGDDTEHA